MIRNGKNQWQGLTKKAQKALGMRNYQSDDFTRRIAETGVDAGELVKASRSKGEVPAWIPGVEIFARQIHSQRHRGSFAELARNSDGPLEKIGLWPKQWSAARMYPHTAKGFHVHPPSIPKENSAAQWFQRQFAGKPKDYSLRRYDEEQWDVMFFLQGMAEMILRDVREGMPSRTMRFFIDGDNHRGTNNIGVIIPPGVAHAIRVEGSEDLIMVYGTSTIFRPEFEGRVAADVELAPLPDSWQTFLKN